MTVRSIDDRRRTVLKLTGAAGATLLAGCLGAGEETEPEPEGEDDDATRDDEEDEERELNPDLSYTAPPEIVDLNAQGGETVLRAVPARHTLVGEEASTGPIELPEVWAWQADDGEPSVPGPIYRVGEGSEVELTFSNTEHRTPHTVHVHAVGKEWMDDGAPTTTGYQVGGGEEHTYRLAADVPGTHFYHCHFDTSTHLDMGMYGIFRVDPEGYEPPDREYFLTLRDWDDRLHRRVAGEDVEFSQRERNSNRYTINGRCAPYTLHPEEGSPLLVESGERVRVHLVNAGYEAHPFHTHGHRFRVIEKDGSPIPEEAQYEEDVVNVAPAERYTIEFEADSDPGLYPAHCHKVNHVMNGETYPGGMLTAIVYEEVLETGEFEDVMALAGAHHGD
ncbi:multicopper oxidase domain-containing protein [Natronorarus salvus]|uniref:multicopper oxidase domain-containing protein n=1 Tax=Natronorarus salvus TaxID=3117733 RepID=UPI002F26236B